MKLKKIIEGDKKYLFQNYGDRLPASFESGNGSRLTDQDGKEYIDFFSGIAVSSIGYGHPAYERALISQLKRIIHTSNWFFNPEQIEAARLISELSFEGKTLFANSGTEANEAAIKLVRKLGLTKSSDNFNIITFGNSFHGRTFGSMSATPQKKIQTGFGPLVPGFLPVPFNDTAAFEKIDKKNTAAVILELIQGEGGIIPADTKFTAAVQKFCDQSGAILIIDEIQTGIGRTGKPFAYQHYGLRPGIITMAKGLAGGLPIGAMHARPELASVLEKGSHGSTFGGNHLSCAGAAVVLKELKKKKFIDGINSSSEILFKRLSELKKRSNIIKEIRGLGLHIGIELSIPGFDLVKRALEMGLIINCTSEKVIRIMPPLNIKKSDIAAGIKIFEKIILSEAPN